MEETAPSLMPNSEPNFNLTSSVNSNFAADSEKNNYFNSSLVRSFSFFIVLVVILLLFAGGWFLMQKQSEIKLVASKQLLARVVKVEGEEKVELFFPEQNKRKLYSLDYIRGDKGGLLPGTVVRAGLTDSDLLASLEVLANERDGRAVIIKELKPEVKDAALLKLLKGIATKGKVVWQGRLVFMGLKGSDNVTIEDNQRRTQVVALSKEMVYVYKAGEKWYRLERGDLQEDDYLRLYKIEGKDVIVVE